MLKIKFYRYHCLKIPLMKDIIYKLPLFEVIVETHDWFYNILNDGWFVNLLNIRNKFLASGVGIVI